MATSHWESKTKTAPSLFLVEIRTIQAPSKEPWRLPISTQCDRATGPHRPAGRPTVADDVTTGQRGPAGTAGPLKGPQRVGASGAVLQVQGAASEPAAARLEASRW